MESSNRYARHEKYRGRIEIVGEILNTVAESNGDGRINKTKIMYKAMLSYAQLKEYLSILVESGLLDYDSKVDGIYKITEKGMNFLKRYNEISEYIRM